MRFLLTRHSLGSFLVLTAILTTNSVVCGHVKRYSLSASIVDLTEGKTPKLQADKAQLTLGQPVDRELKAGATDVYRIRLMAGEYLQLSIAQLNIDVRYSISEPDGKKIGTMNWEDQDSPESLWLAAEESGRNRNSTPRQTGKSDC